MLYRSRSNSHEHIVRLSGRHFVDQKKFESYFSGRPTFSNIRGRTNFKTSSTTAFSRNAFLVSKLMIFLFNAHLALFLQRMT